MCCFGRLLALPEGALYVIVAMAFAAEYLLFSFHSTTHVGLEGRYHEILVILIGLCVAFALLSAAFPRSFTVDLASGISLTLQGLWFYQIAFTLYGPLIPSGCLSDPDGPLCESRESEMRGQSLANVQLNLLVSCVLLAVVALYGAVAALCGHRHRVAMVAEPMTMIDR
jgi:hypothetical protein